MAEYAESGTKGDVKWTRVLEDYYFRADGTGYFECYQLDGNKFVYAESVRDDGTLHYTISGNTIIITGDDTNLRWTLTYADDKLTDPGQMKYSRGTSAQSTLVDQLYADWQGSQHK